MTEVIYGKNKVNYDDIWIFLHAVLQHFPVNLPVTYLCHEGNRQRIGFSDRDRPQTRKPSHLMYDGFPDSYGAILFSFSNLLIRHFIAKS